MRVGKEREVIEIGRWKRKTSKTTRNLDGKGSRLQKQDRGKRAWKRKKREEHKRKEDYKRKVKGKERCVQEKGRGKGLRSTRAMKLERKGARTI